MTTARDIVVGAFREGNLVPVGSEPTEAEIGEGLSRFNNLLVSFFGVEIGESLSDWEFPNTHRGRLYTPETYSPGDLHHHRADSVSPTCPNPNTRILVLGAGTVNLPEKPTDGARMAVAVLAPVEVTFDAGNRMIEGVPALTLPPEQGVQREWFYRADLGDWIRIQPLGEDDESPLPAIFDDFLIAGLAIRLAPRYSNQPGVATVATFSRMKAVAAARYRQRTAVLTSLNEPPFRGKVYG